MIIRVIFLSFIFLSISFQASAETIKLDDLINVAIKNNPEVQELSNKVKASALREPQEKALDDPIFGVGFMDVPLNVPAFGTTNMTGAEVFISQKFPISEKLWIKEKMAKIITAMDTEMLQEKINEIKKKITFAYYDLYLVNKSLEITKENKELMKDFSKISESRYITGSGTQQDIIKANIEVTKLGQNMIELAQNKLNSKFEINNLLNRFPSSDLGEPAEIKLTPLKTSLKELEQIALEKRPMLKNADNAIDMSDHEIHLAKLEYIPDFEFSLNYHAWIDRADLISGNVSINLPVWYKDKQNNKVKEKEYSLLGSQQAKKSSINEVLLNIAKLSSQINKDREMYDLLTNGIIPQMEQALKSGIISYQAGKADFLSLRDSQVNLLNYRLEAIKNLVEHEKAIAELKFEIGSELVQAKPAVKGEK